MALHVDHKAEGLPFLVGEVLKTTLKKWGFAGFRPLLRSGAASGASGRPTSSRQRTRSCVHGDA